MNIKRDFPLYEVVEFDKDGNFLSSVIFDEGITYEDILNDYTPKNKDAYGMVIRKRNGFSYILYDVLYF